MSTHLEKIQLLAPYSFDTNKPYFIITGDSLPVTLALTLQLTLFMLSNKQNYLLNIKVFNPENQEVANSVAKLTPDSLKLPEENIVSGDRYISGFTLSTPNVNFYKGIFKIQVNLSNEATNEFLDTANTFIVVKDESNK